MSFPLRPSLPLPLLYAVRMLDCHRISREQWQLRQKLRVKQRLRYASAIFTSFQIPRLPFKVIAAQGEMSAARALKEAAEVIANSPTALQLRYLQTLNVIAAEKGSTILFPIPMDMLGGMQAWGAGGGQVG